MLANARLWQFLHKYDVLRDCIAGCEALVGEIADIALISVWATRTPGLVTMTAIGRSLHFGSGISLAWDVMGSDQGRRYRPRR